MELMELHFPEVITYIDLCRSADTGSWDAETAYPGEIY